MCETTRLLTPPGLAGALPGVEWELAYEYAEHSVVYRLSRHGSIELYLKLAPTEHYPTLAAEAERMRWPRAYLPVPEVVEQGTEGSTSWLVTSRLSGQNGAHPEQLRRPEELTRILARALRRFHEAAPSTPAPSTFASTPPSPMHEPGSLSVSWTRPATSIQSSSISPRPKPRSCSSRLVRRPKTSSCATATTASRTSSSKTAEPQATWTSASWAWRTAGRTWPWRRGA